MMLSDEKITHMSHVLLRELKNRNLIKVNEEEGKVTDQAQYNRGTQAWRRDRRGGKTKTQFLLKEAG